MFIIVGILVAIVIGLLIYNVQIHRKIQEFNSLQRQANNLRVLQDFLSTIGETSSVDDKIKKINDILIEKYEIKYSTIVVFDGAEYQIKATNVDQKHWETLRNLQDVPIFKDSIATATPKYITINNENEKLPYQTMEFARAKSAIFFPIYEDNVYIGYWIIESGIAHDFDNIDTTIFEVVKDNIVAVLKTVVHQKTLEAIVRKDLFTGLYSEEYLYGEGKKTIDQYTTSAVCMFRIANIEEINDKYSRKLGNQVIIDISKYIRKNISNEYIFIRYMGPKFVIVFSGVTTDSVIDFITNIKSNAEQMNISLEENFQTVDLDDEEKNALKLNFTIKNADKDTILELPYIFYPGYRVNISYNGETTKLATSESENGFVQIVIPDNIGEGKIQCEYTGTKLEKASYIISLLGIIAFIAYIIYSKKKHIKPEKRDEI